MKHNLFALTVASCSLAVALFTSPALTAGDKGAGIGPSFKGPLGLQLYSLRDQFKTNVNATLAKVERFGFRYAELAGTYGLPPEQFLARLDDHHIKAIAGHFSYDEWKKDPEAVAKQAKELKLKYAGCAWIPHQGPFDEKLCREAAAVFNKAGETLKRHGMRFFYHVHGYEFVPTPNGTLFDLLMQETDPKLVAYEMDIFWVVFPGQDPVKLLEKYGQRWELMHLKDMRKGLKTGSLSGGTDVTNDVGMGEGQIDLPPLLKAAKKAKVKWYFIEDESPSVLQQLPGSLLYLENVRF